MYPYVIDHGIEDLQFIIHNDEARSWYDPLRPYTKLEYDWVRENVDLGEAVIDAGCHHGNYSVVFKPAYVIGVDCVQLCLQYALENAELNGVEFESHLISLGEQGAPRTSVQPAVYKVDIEGAEFRLFPAEIERFYSVHTWIVEIHPRKGDPQRIAQDFLTRGFDLLKVDREKMIVRPYVLGELWPTHATLIARRHEP